jgi:plastocyanin
MTAPTRGRDDHRVGVDGEYGSTDGDTAEGTDGTIVAEDFSLTDITVAPGAEIVLQNDGAATHTATADDGSFDLGEVAGGETSDPGTAPTTPGEYPFHCEIHDSMTATLTVEG